MRFLLIIWLISFSSPAISQGNIEKLACQLTSTAKTDKEKVTRIFYWITDNISYRAKAKKVPYTRKAGLQFSNEDENDLSPLLPLNERIANNVLSSGVAVCDGYARLFTALCDYAGIESKMIVGYGNANNGTKFGVNHYWNAVFFDGIWHLLDASWASGYISRQNGEFVKEYTPGYFLTDPKIFIRDHYPDDPRWTLLADASVPDQFKRSPFKQKSFLKYSITSFQPSRGLIDAEVGDTIRLELETADINFDRKISPGLLIDSSLFSYSPTWVFLHPSDSGTTQNKHQYIYKIESEDIEWLFLLYNQDIVLRYKVNVKKKKT